MLAALAGSFFGATAARAQNASSGAVDDRAIGDVVVTAERRPESQSDVPISLISLSGTDLDKAGVDRVADLSQLVPGLHIDTSGAFLQPSIRGVGTAIGVAGASSNIATYVDGAYRPNPLTNNFGFNDTESVQVLKGPQGALYGLNATGGAIVVTTKTPSFEPRMDIQAGYGSFDTFRGAAFLSNRLTDKLAFSLALAGDRSDGWLTNVLTGKGANPSRQYGGRAKLLFEPASALRFTLILDAYHLDDPTLYAVTAYRGRSDAILFGVPLGTNGPRTISLSGPIAHRANGGGVEIKAEVDLGFATLTSYSAAHWDRGREALNEMAAAFPVDGSLPISPTIQSAVESAEWHYREATYSQTVDISHSGRGPLIWIAGLFYFHDVTTDDPLKLSLFGPFGPGGLLTGGVPDPATHLFPASAYISTGNQPFSRFSGVSRSAAAFADATYSWRNLHLTIGARYSIDWPGARFASIPAVANGFTGGSLSASHRFRAFTPRLGVRYSLGPRSSIYVTYSEGTKAGLFNSSALSSDPKPLRPEFIKNIEGGIKISGRQSRLEVSAFHYDYSNLQVATYSAGLATLQNAPSAEIFGFDLHWEQRISRHLLLNVGGAYTHARYTDFPNAAYQTFSPVRGVVNGTLNVDGRVMERTPALMGAASLQFTTSLLGGDLELDSNVSYQSRAFFDFAGTLEQGPYALVNLRASWTPRRSHWSASLIGTNVTDTIYRIQITPTAGGFGAVYGKPAAVMFQLRYRH